MFLIKMRVPEVDLYTAINSLLDQIPEGRVSTPYHLASSLGDSDAAPSISRIMRNELRKNRHKIVENLVPETKIFRDFSSDMPLKRLAELQLSMSKRVIQEDDFKELNRFAGVDAAYRGYEVYAVCVIMERSFKILEKASTVSTVHFPYISGYFMFREAPSIERTSKLVSEFDLLFVNGHGIAHPRCCGLATCVGLELDIPTIGIARRRLVSSNGEKHYDCKSLLRDGASACTELRTDSRSPLYVSVGHRISLETSVKIVNEMMLKGNLPEPLRSAHIDARREMKKIR